MKHHIFKSEKWNVWFHCGKCPCGTMNRMAHISDCDGDCINADSGIIVMMQETGMFGQINQNPWWLNG